MPWTRLPCWARSWRHRWSPAVAITVTGVAGAVFSLARQAYLTEAIPLLMRARALSTLGGTFRVGLFIGPFIAAAIVGSGASAPRTASPPRSTWPPPC